MGNVYEEASAWSRRLTNAQQHFRTSVVEMGCHLTLEEGDEDDEDDSEDDDADTETEEETEEDGDAVATGEAVCWVEYADATTGAFFYHNAQTQECVWSLPRGAIAMKPLGSSAPAGL